MVQGKLLSYGDDISEALYIRKKVFVDEMGMPEELDNDENDEYALHVIVYEEGINRVPVATGRLLLCNKSCYIDKIAVLKEYRGKHYGDFSVRMLIYKAFEKGFTEINLICNNYNEKFFEKIGFMSENDVEYGRVGTKMKLKENNVIKNCNK